MHNMIRGMLDPEVEKRLGCGFKGVKDIKKHLLFQDYPVDWEALQDKTIRPPWLPPLQQARDLSHYPDRPEDTPQEKGNESGWTPVMW